MNKPATIKDIARQLNVSISTVSRAMRNAPDVNIDTRKAVMALSEELNYQPNKLALSLKQKQTHTIGVIVPNLDYVLATMVKGIDEALAHIEKYSTKHSEAIVSENKKACQRFIKEVDAAAVFTNASTRFTDGEAFGLGAEIGISTQKLHARGPFALEKLVTEKWVVTGNGQIR